MHARLARPTSVFVLLALLAPLAGAATVSFIRNPFRHEKNPGAGSITVTETGTVHWKANVPARVFVSTNDRREISVAEHPEGEVTPPWLSFGNTYCFTLREMRTGRLLDSITVAKDEFGRMVKKEEPWLGKFRFPLALLASAIILVVLASPPRRLSTLPVLNRLDPCFLVIVAVELAIFSIGFDGYFFEDSLSQLMVRPRTVQQALASFATIEIWYRPLSQRVLAYILFPLFRARFALYHGLLLFLHIVVSFVVYRALRRLVDDRLAAFAGAFYFGVHAINFYTTYDNAFLAESLLALFYTLSVWAFVERRFWPAFGLFVLALLSKEAAVTLPVVLGAAVVTVPSLRARWKTFARGLVPFAAALAVYVLLYSRALHVAGIRVSSSERPDYALSFGWNVLRNALRYLHWAFEIPDGWATENWFFQAPGSYLLYACLLVVAVFAVIAAARRNVNVRAGLLWFILTALPTLALVNYFPHHLYLPLIGLSLVVAQFFAWAAGKLPRIAWLVVLGAFCFNHARTSYLDNKNDLYSPSSWVGRSAMIYKNAARFIERHAHRLAAGSVVYVVNETPDPLVFDLRKNRVFNFASSLDDLQVNVVTQHAEVPVPIPENALIATYSDRCFLDETAAFPTSFSANAAWQPRPRGGISITAAGMLSWEVDGDAMVFVNVDGGPDALMARHPTGQTTPDFLSPDHTYRFTLKAAAEHGAGKTIDSVFYRRTKSGHVEIGKIP